MRVRPAAGGGPLRALRLLALALCLLTLLSAGHSLLTNDAVVHATTPSDSAPAATGADPRVVVTVDGVGPGQIVAYDADGNVVYHDDSLSIYHDVDPSPAGEHTVTYVASDTADSDACPEASCLRNVIERVNLTTGETTRLYARIDGQVGSTQIHDVDRVNESVFLIADISFPDRVYMVNATTGEELWEWKVSAAYGPESGGAYPGDWTHVNDVEHLPDGRVMVNLRNQDQVVFIEPGEGIQSSWTLGADGNHGTLYEPHNPDYIPESRGGPAVVVADSENNRLVEYQRRNGTWERTWHWQDTRLQWPRDADRLPSGRTLVADSHGRRILSVRPDGGVAWSHPFPTGSYDVELLGTGEESAGGRSAAALGLRSRWPSTPRADDDALMAPATVGPGRPGHASAAEPHGAVAGGTGSGEATVPRLSVLEYHVVSLVPSIVLHGALYTLPSWMTAIDAVLVLATGVVGGGWLVAEVGARALPWTRRP